MDFGRQAIHMILPICDIQRCISLVRDPPTFSKPNPDEIIHEILVHVKTNFPLDYFRVLRECPAHVIYKEKKLFFELFFSEMFESDEEMSKRVCRSYDTSDICSDLSLLDGCPETVYLKVFNEILHSDPVRLVECFRYGTPEIVETLKKERIYDRFVKSLMSHNSLSIDIENMYI